MPLTYLCDRWLSFKRVSLSHFMLMVFFENLMSDMTVSWNNEYTHSHAPQHTTHRQNLIQLQEICGLRHAHSLLTALAQR